MNRVVRQMQVCAAVLPLCGIAALAELSALPPPPLPAFTSNWQRVFSREIPVKQTNAQPFVAAADPHQRLWLADQADHKVFVYDSRGQKRERLSIDPRGRITAIGFDDGGRALIATQRGDFRWPLGQYYVFSMSRSSGNHISSVRTRTYPQYWTGRNVADELELACRRGEYTAATSPSNITCRTIAMSPRGTVCIAVPLLSILERHSADGTSISVTMLERLRPMSPCWVIAVGDTTLLMGDALQKRVVLTDLNGQAKKAWSCEYAARLIAAPRSGHGWLILDPVAGMLERFDRDGEVAGAWTLPFDHCIAALEPERDRLWLFDATTWIWHGYRPAK